MASCHEEANGHLPAPHAVASAI